MSHKSTFGAKPEQLKLLLTAIGMDESNPGEQSNQKASSAMPDKSLVERAGTQIGRYKLIRTLGEGGMGIVYLAEQQGSIRRRVALKVIKPGMDSKRVLARFEAERQVLALLDHPNIAHVYDTGMTETGRPYFVMEHVKGLPVTEHCDHYKLTITERLRLFQQVCQAVQHAHQKGIIHRDIKPSNILVTIHEDQAIPKIIDFGVAKAVLQPLTDRTLYTEQGQLFGTPEYMSPEQADMASEDIDTRSDIYSLGVLLYELLTGVLPFDSETLHGGGIDRIRKVICETDPKTPSTRLTRLGEESQKVAENRRTEIGTLAKHLRKELEWIPLKAMRKERSERYRSASELADDVENYLQGNPLIAGPVTITYRIKKFVRRNRALVAGILAVLITSIIGTVVAMIFAIGQTRARDDAEAVADFLTQGVFRSADKIRGRDATMIDVLDVSSEDLEGRFQDQPLVEERIRWALGVTYRKLAHYRSAISHFERAHAIHRGRPPGKRSWEGFPAYLAQAYNHAGEYGLAEDLLVELIEETPAKWQIPWFKCSLACVYKNQGRYKEAEQLILETWKHNRFATPSWRELVTHPFQDHLAEVYLYQGRYEEAEQLYTEFLEKNRDVRQRHDLLTREPMTGLAHLYMIQGRYEDANDLLTRAMEIGRIASRGSEHPVTFLHMNCLAVLRTKQSRFEEAESLFSQALEGRQRRLGEDHPATLETINDLGLLRIEQKRYEEAEELLIKARDGRLMKLGPDHPYTLESILELAVLYKKQGDYEKAEPLLLKAVEGRRLKLGNTHPNTIKSLKNLIALYEAGNKPELSDQWRAKQTQIEDFEE